MTIVCTMLLMIEAIICPTQPPPYRSTDGVQVGYLSQYGPDVSAWMVEYGQQRGYLPHDLTGIDGFIAVDDCGLVGRPAWLSVEGDEWLHVYVYDCTVDTDTLWWMHEHNILAEVSHNIAEQYGFVGRGGVRAQLSWTQPAGKS